MGDFSSERCESHISCKSCSASGACHWCGDALNGQCYGKYNYFGCVWSTACKDLDKCVRHQPEFVGPASRANDFRYGLLALSLWCLIFFPLLFRGSIASIFKKKLQKLDDSELEEPLLDASEYVDNAEESVETGAKEESSEPNPSRKFGKISCFFQVVCFILASLILIAIVALTYISPQTPDFSVCTSELSIESLLDTFIHFDYMVQGNYILQASIYNPNRFDLILEKSDGYFRYKGNTIGTFKVDWKHHAENEADSTRNIPIPGGSIYDVLLVTKMDIPIGTAMEMANTFRTGDLILEVGNDVKAGVQIASYMAYRFDYSIPPTNVSLSELDDKRCKCRSVQPPS